MLDAAILAGNHEAALRICAAWTAGNPGTLGPLFSEARTYREMSQTDRALDCYRRILQIAPEGRHVERVRQFIRELEEAKNLQRDCSTGTFRQQNEQSQRITRRHRRQFQNRAAVASGNRHRGLQRSLITGVGHRRFNRQAQRAG